MINDNDSLKKKRQTCYLVQNCEHNLGEYLFTRDHLIKCSQAKKNTRMLQKETHIVTHCAEMIASINMKVLNAANHE